MNPLPDSSSGIAPAATEFPPELRERLRLAEPAALALFFDTYFDRVYGYIRRFVPDDHLAEDLTQDVFLHVQRSLATYDPGRDPRPWVFTIATNQLRDHWRSRANQSGRGEGAFDLDVVLERLPAPELRPDSKLSEEELGNQVRSAIDHLPEGMRAAVLLRAFEGLSFEEIGHVLERNEVAARKRYSRALELLREALGRTWQLHGGGPR